MLEEKYNFMKKIMKMVQSPSQEVYLSAWSGLNVGSIFQQLRVKKKLSVTSPFCFSLPPKKERRLQRLIFFGDNAKKSKKGITQLKINCSKMWENFFLEDIKKRLHAKFQTLAPMVWQERVRHLANFCVQSNPGTLKLSEKIPLCKLCFEYYMATIIAGTSVKLMALQNILLFM